MELAIPGEEKIATPLMLSLQAPLFSLDCIIISYVH